MSTIPVKVKYPIVGRIYENYKGGTYEVLMLAKHSETNETLVIYKSLLFGSNHARPLDVWNEKITINKNKTINRFTLISNKNV